MYGTSIIEIGIAFVTGSCLFFGTKFIVLKESAKRFIQKHSLLHPNTISIVRVPLALGSFFAYFSQRYLLGIILYTVSVVSDGVDGIIARNCSLESKTGKWLDPLSDKLVYFIPLIYFTAFGNLGVWGVTAFIIIDTFGQFSRIILDALKMETKANIFGKVKTVFVFFWIFYLMLFERYSFDTAQINSYALLLANLGAILSIVFKFVAFPTIKK